MKRLMLLLALGACAPVGDFPSLRPRPLEQGVEAAMAEPPAVPQRPADPALVGRVQALLAEGRTGESAFRGEVGAAERAVAAAGAAESDSWVEAHTTRSGLDSARAATVQAITDLDALLLVGTPSEADQAAVRTASGELSALASAQDALLDRLAARLRPA